MKGQQKLFGLFFKQVHEDEVIREFREVPDGGPAHISGLRVIERRDVMGYIHDPEIGIELQELCLHRTHQVIRAANIGCEGDKRQMLGFSVEF